MLSPAALPCCSLYFTCFTSTMAAYHQTPLATAIPIPAPEAAGEYSLSRKSTDVDESMVKALRGQGFTRGKSTHTWKC